MVESAEYRTAMSRWPTGVAVVGVNVDGRIVATTVSALLSLSLDPPQVLFSLNPNATVRPFVQVGSVVGISLLGEHQRRLATVFADPFPVGPDPFRPGSAIIADAMTALMCTATEVRDAGDHAVVIARVDDIAGSGGDPIVRHGGQYRTLAP